jgi:hypothetical protein
VKNTYKTIDILSCVLNLALKNLTKLSLPLRIDMFRVIKYEVHMVNSYQKGEGEIYPLKCFHLGYTRMDEVKE